VIAPVQTPAPAPAAQDNAPQAAKEEPVVTPAEPVKPVPEAAESSPVAATPVFRTRADLGKPAQSPIQTVIPIVRAPDDPGIDDDGPSDEFTEQIGTPKAQAGGWRGFWSRWGA
jgi:HemY protein